MIEVGSKRKQTSCFKQKLMLPYLRWHFFFHPWREYHPCSAESSFFVRLQVAITTSTSPKDVRPGHFFNQKQGEDRFPPFLDYPTTITYGLQNQILGWSLCSIVDLVSNNRPKLEVSAYQQIVESKNFVPIPNWMKVQGGTRRAHESGTKDH